MKNTLLKTALVPLILIIALVSFGYIYIHNKIKDNVNQSIEARTKVISLNEEELSLKILRSGTDSSLEKRQDVLKYFVPEDDLVSF
ncbi:MAG: hypothetical protein Q7R78_01390, partial [bacterium]|nr:hypothetical protein [bacterium]